MPKKEAAQKKSIVRKKILRASEKLFSQKGFAGTGIDEISKKAGITKSLIYYYFKNKDEILDQIIKNFINEGTQLKKQQIEMLKKKPGSVREMLKNSLEYAEKRKDVLKIMLIEALKDSYRFPLFMYLDVSSKTGYEGLKEITSTVPDEFETYLKGFFIGFMPIISYVMFIEEWCKHYKIDREKAKEKILDFHTDIYKKWLFEKN